MSRGLGAIQRALLAAIEARGESSKDWADTFELVVAAYDMKPDMENRIMLLAVQVNAVRRALKGLVAKERIIGTRGWRGNRARWCTPQAFEAYERRVKQAFGTAPHHRMVGGGAGVRLRKG